MKRRFYRKDEIQDELKELNDKVAEIFFKGETHADVKNIETKNATSFDDTSMYTLYEVNAGYERPLFQYLMKRINM